MPDQKRRRCRIARLFLFAVLLSGFIWQNRVWGGVAKEPLSPLQTVTKVFYRMTDSSQSEAVPVWVFHDTDRGWNPVRLRSLAPGFAKGSLWLKLILPHGNWQEPGLFLEAPVRNFAIYEGGHKIYQSRDGLHERRWLRSNLRAHFVRLLRGKTPHTVYMRIRADRFCYAQVWGEFKIGSQADYILDIIRTDLADAILSFILFFIALFLLGFQASRSGVYLPFVGIGLYALCNGLNFIAGLVIMQLIWDAPLLRYFGEALGYYLIPVGIILFVATFTDNIQDVRDIKPVYKILMLIDITHAVLLLTLDVNGVISIYATYQWFNVFLIGTALFLIGAAIRRGREANLDMKLVLWGGIVSGLAGMHDAIGLTTGFFLLGRYLINWGMLLFAIVMIIFVVKRYINANLELTALNKTLEERVAARSEELAGANVTLRRLNQEIHLALQDLEETQIKLVQAEGMALLGNLVSGVAHEINTPLGAIKANVAMEEKIRRGLEAAQGKADLVPQSAAAYAAKIMSLNKINQMALERIGGLVKNLTNFARPNEAEYKRADLRKGLDSTLLIIGHQLKGRIEVIRDYGAIPPLRCYPQQLNQVFLNLLTNAVQAIEGKGCIVIQTRYSAGQIQISIKDTGSGILPQNLERLFEPGFTTKPSGVGSGLGLSISRAIIAHHGGCIRVSSTPGQGAEFIIELPVTEKGKNQDGTPARREGTVH